MTIANEPAVGVAALTRLRSAFGVEPIGHEIEYLAGGLSGDRVFTVRCRQGSFVVKHWESEDEVHADKTAALQETIRRGGAPVPAHRKSASGRFVEGRMTVQEFAPGRSLSTWSIDQASKFGAALGQLDRALAACPVDAFFANQSSVFSRCKDVEQVATRYLPACDGRLPAGYREHVMASLQELDARLAPISGQPRVLVHVDGNPENVIFDDAGNVRLIDLTPEARPAGYSLGAALYWWAYPWQADRLSLDVSRAVTRAYLADFALSPPLRRAIAAHMLNHSLMELAFPLGCLVDGPPPGARPMKDLDGRLRRATTLLAAIDQVERAVMDT